MTLRQRYLRILAAAVSLTVAAVCMALPGDLPRATPESTGMHSADVLRFIEAVTSFGEQAECHGAIVVRHGKVIGEVYPRPFRPAYRQTLYSCSKTFTAAAVGLAVDDSLLRVTDRVADILRSDMPLEISPELARMTVADLLKMASGITPDWTMRNVSHNWLLSWFSKPVSEPGSRFAYDSMSTYALSAIVQRVEGRTVLDLLNERIFGPLEITDAEWEESPHGINTGGWGLHVRPEDMAKFGLLLLNRGRWGDRQLLSEEWINSMMTPQIPAGGGAEYGYQMWRCEEPQAWRADGAYGQYIFVIPQADMVVVMTQASHMGALANRAPVWALVSSAMSAEPLETSPETALLARRQWQYQFRPPQGQPFNRIATTLGGTRLQLARNDLEWASITPRFEDNRMVLGITTEWGDSYDIPCGYGKWLTDTTNVCPPYSIKAIDRFRGIERRFYVSGAYAWQRNGVLDIHVFYPSWITGARLSYDPRSGTITVRQNTVAKPYTLRATPVRRLPVN